MSPGPSFTASLMIIPGVVAASRRTSGTTPVEGHRFWRINVTDNNGSAANNSIGTIEFRESRFGPNLAVGGTALSGGNGTDAEGPEDAFSSDPLLFWSRGVGGGSPFPMWCGYDFGTPVEIQCAIITARPEFLTDTPADFQVQYSDDGSTWTTAWSVSSETGWVKSEPRVFLHPDYVTPAYLGSPHGTHVYWRLVVADNNGSVSNLGLAEVQFRASPATPQTSTGGTATASDSFSGAYPGSNAFDSNPATMWVTALGPPMWVAYEHAATRECSEIQITSRPDGFQNDSPETCSVQWSDDGTSWNHAWYFDGATGWSAGETRIFTDPDYLVSTYNFTIPAGAVASDLTNFPVMVKLAQMPDPFWEEVRSDGGDIRVTTTGGALVPIDMAWIDPDRKDGLLVFKAASVLAASDNSWLITGGNSSLSLLPATDTNGRNAVWSDYHRVMLLDASLTDRTGSGATVARDAGVGDWDRAIVRHGGPIMANNSHAQGMTWDGTHFYCTDNNRISKYTVAGTRIVFNADPNGDAGVGTSHCGDICVHNGMVYVPMEVYTNDTTYSLMHIGRFDAEDLSFIDIVDVSAQGHEVSGICYCPIDDLMYVCSYGSGQGNRLWRYDPVTLAFDSVLTMTATIPHIQSVEWWNDAFYVTSNNESVRSIDYDGTVRGFATFTSEVEALAAKDDDTIFATNVYADTFYEYKRMGLTKPGWLGLAQGLVTIGGVSKFTQWSFGATVLNHYRSGNQAIASYQPAGTGSSDRAYMAMYQAGGFGQWNSTDGWSNEAPSTPSNADLRYNSIFDGTTARITYRDGVAVVTDNTVSQRPTGTAPLTLYLGGEDSSVGEWMHGDQNFVYLRNGVLSGDWFAAETKMIKTPSLFYEITPRGAGNSTLLVSTGGTSITANTTNTYVEPLGIMRFGRTTQELLAGHRFPVKGRLRHFRALITANTRTTTSNVRLRRNNLNTDLLLTITAGTTGWIESANHSEVLVEPGDLISLAVGTGASGGGITVQHTVCEFEADDGIVTLYRYTGNETVTYDYSGKRYGRLVNMARATIGGWESTSSVGLTQQHIGAVGVYSHMEVALEGNTSDAGVTFTLMKNGIATAMTVTFGPGETGRKRDETNTVAVVPGDYLEWEMDCTGRTTGGFKLSAIEIMCTSSNGDWDLFATTVEAEDPGGFAQSTPVFLSGTRVTPNTNEAMRGIKFPFSADLVRFCAIATENTAGGSYDITNRINGVDTSVEVTVPASSYLNTLRTDTTHTASLDPDDILTTSYATLGGLSGIYYAGWTLRTTGPSARS